MGRMTKTEAIKWLKAIKDKYIHGGDEDFDRQRCVAIDMAVRFLEGIEPEAIKDCRNCKHGKYNDCFNVLFCNCNGDCKDWEKWESKEPLRGKGHWIMKWHNFFQREMPTCSECGTGSVFKTKFCHECGADMRGDLT